MRRLSVEHISSVEDSFVASCVTAVWHRIPHSAKEVLAQRLKRGIQDVDVSSRWFVAMTVPCVGLWNHWSVTLNAWHLRRYTEADVCYVVAQQLALVLVSHARHRLRYFFHDFTAAEKTAAEALAVIWGFTPTGHAFQANVTLALSVQHNG